MTSDPYGQPDWRNPYGQYGQDPYGQYVHYGQDPYAQYAQDTYEQYAQGLYARYPQPSPASTGPPTVALLANVIAAVLCCGIGIAWLPGVVLAALALNRAKSDPESSRRLTVGAWACLVADIVLTFVVLVVYGLVAGDPVPAQPGPAGP